MKTIINQHLLAVALYAGLLAVAACRKDRPEPEAAPLPAELKAYTLFQPGTYWIY